MKVFYEYKEKTVQGARVVLQKLGETSKAIAVSTNKKF